MNGPGPAPARDEHARHGWIVTDDYLYQGPDDPLPSSVGTIGPDDVAPGVRALLRAGTGQVWRVWDDDGVCYLRGRMIIPDDATEQECVSPLRDYAVGLGATRLQFRDGRRTRTFEV